MLSFKRRSCSADVASSEDSSEVFVWTIHRLPPLLTVAVSHPWFLGRISRLRRPPPLPLLSRVGSRRVSRVRRPFRLPPAAPASPVATEKGPGKSPPDRVLPLLRVEVVCRHIGGTGRQMEQIPGCYLS